MGFVKTAPTPWIIDTQDMNGYSSKIFITNSGHNQDVGVKVSFIGAADYSHDEYEEIVKATAAFIVRAVNSHKVLVNALREISKFEESHSTGDMIDIAKKALTKVTGEA